MFVAIFQVQCLLIVTVRMMIHSQTVMRTAYLMDMANNKWYLTFILLTHCILYALNSNIF